MTQILGPRRILQSMYFTTNGNSRVTSLAILSIIFEAEHILGSLNVSCSFPDKKYGFQNQVHPYPSLTLTQNPVETRRDLLYIARPAVT